MSRSQGKQQVQRPRERPHLPSFVAEFKMAALGSSAREVSDIKSQSQEGTGPTLRELLIATWRTMTRQTRVSSGIGTMELA